MKIEDAKKILDTLKEFDDTHETTVRISEIRKSDGVVFQVKIEIFPI